MARCFLNGSTNEADYPPSVDEINVSQVGQYAAVSGYAIETREGFVDVRGVDSTEPVWVPVTPSIVVNEEELCPGGSSTTSTSKPRDSKTTGAPTRSRPAPTTGNRSLKGRTGSGSAGSTAGGKPNDTATTE